LAHRQHAARGNIRVLEEFVSDEFVVVRRFGILDDGLERGEMRRTQEMIDVVERGLRQRARASRGTTTTSSPKTRSTRTPRSAPSVAILR
jgi:hypothetical protein